MERDKFEELIDRLDELQDASMERHEQHTGPSDERTPKSMYYLGKDIGIAEAKRVLRERLDVTRDSIDVDE